MKPTLNAMLAAERGDLNFHPSMVGIPGRERLNLLKVVIWLESTRSIESCIEIANRNLKAAA